MVNVKGATPEILGVIGTVSLLLGLSLQVPVGRLADKIGRKKTFFVFTPFYYLGILTLIAAPSPEYLILAGILGGAGGGVGIGGGIGGVAFIPFITMWWESVPAGKRGKWYGLEGVITAIPRIFVSMFGGILWDQGFKIPILLAPVLIGFLVVIPLLHTIPETLGSNE